MRAESSSPVNLTVNKGGRFRPFAGMGRNVLLSHSSNPAARFLVAALFLAAYIGLEWVSFVHEYKGLPVTPWNPGLGVVFALLIFAGRGSGLVLFAGVIIAESLVLRSRLDWPIILGIGAIIALSYSLAAAAARWYFRLDIGLVHLRDVLALLAVGVAGAAVNSVLLTAFFLAFGTLDIRDLSHASVPLLIGDIIGIAVTTPLMLRFVFDRRHISFPRLRSILPEGALYIVVLVAALWAMVVSDTASGFRLFYLLFIPTVIAAVRYGLDGACLALAVTQLGVVALLHINDYDARAFTELQLLMLVLTTTGLIVGVVVSERRTSDQLAREAEARLRIAEAEAAQAARVNLVSSMASTLAHEINQPMTAARALARSAQHILRIGGDQARADRNLTAAITEIDHISSVVRHMRDFLRRGRPHVSTIEIRDMLEQALTLVRTEASWNQILAELDVPETLPPVYGDRIQLQQVILNLIRNAMEAIAGARQTGGRIRVTAQQFDAPKRIEIAVVDNGPGVPDELAEKLFHPLTTSKHEGLGLGLPICASIVESHGGKIWLQTRAPGATEFRLSLPLGQIQAV